MAPQGLEKRCCGVFDASTRAPGDEPSIQFESGEKAMPLSEEGAAEPVGTGNVIDMMSLLKKSVEQKKEPEKKTSEKKAAPKRTKKRKTG
jgi:hypothetical protein